MRCVDGTWSHAGGISGACSDHGGEANSQSQGETGDSSAAPSTAIPAAQPDPETPSGSGGLRPCDQNISANAITSCGFAENTFYEYWQATGGDPTPGEQPVDVWSPATPQDYTQVCTDGGNEVECTHSDGDEVQFSTGSVMAYTQTQANVYAATGTLGP